jgi:hypothetical protein
MVQMPAPVPSNFNLPTFTVAAIGAATGLFSVIWNVVPHVSSGAKVLVKIHYVLHGPDGPFFEVHAYNRRRAPVEIRNCGIAQAASSKDLGTVMLAGAAAISDSPDKLPKTVDGGHVATWGVSASELGVFELNDKHHVEVRGVVELGNGKERRSRPLKLPVGALNQRPTVAPDDERPRRRVWRRFRRA